MGHDWLFEVLADMRTYAERHGFSALVAKLDEAEAVARDEVRRGNGSNGGIPHKPARRN